MTSTRWRPHWALFTILFVLASSFALAPIAQAGDPQPINVDTTDDELGGDEGGDCSLREAIQSANTASSVDGCETGSTGHDTIIVPAGTYPLTRTNAAFPENSNDTGDLDITEDLTIQSTGGRAIIDAGLNPGAVEGRIECSNFSDYNDGINDRVLHVMDSDVTLIGLGIRGGHVSSDGDDTSTSGGGGIFSNENSSLTLNDTRVRRNAAIAQGEFSESGGGGIFSRGDLDVNEDSVVEENAVLFAEEAAGAGIAVEALILTRESGTAPSADTIPQGIPAGSQGEIRDSRVNHNILCNTSFGIGGGIATNSSLLVQRSSIDHNTIDATEAGGGGIGGVERNGSAPSIAIRSSDVNSNEARGFSRSAGGGILSAGGSASIDRSTVSGNQIWRGFQQGGVGGGVANVEFGFMQIDDSTIDNNLATQDPPLDREAPQPQGTGQQPPTFGGGVFGDQGFTFLLNSTITRNEADRGGGAFFFAFGGKGPTFGADFEHVTVARNEALVAGGGLDASLDGGVVDVDSSIVGLNTPEDCGSDAITSDDWNVVSDDSCDFTQAHDLLNRNPRLGSLADNGGPTRTLLPEDDSPAVDHVGPSDPKSNNGCPPPGQDQRGVDRPKDGDGNGSERCDAGSVEIKEKKNEPFCEGFKGDSRNQIVGTNEKDTLVGTNGPDIICGKGDGDNIKGGDGNDIILGGPGPDNLQGGDGNDKIRANTEGDKVDGGNGDDELHGGSQNDFMLGGPGDDLIQGHLGNDHMDGESGDDRVEGHEDNDDVIGGSDDDSLQGGGGNDNIKGQGGNDKLKGLQGSDDLDGGANNDECDAGEGTGQSVVNCES